MGKVALYANTIRYLKPEQLFYQVMKRTGRPCPLIKGYTPTLNADSLKVVPALKELDYDTEFLNRFCVDELMCDKITLLHSGEQLDLKGSWFFEERSPLWNHNLHYFEYLFALAKKYEETSNTKYFDKIKSYITAWVEHNPQGSKNSAWEVYPIVLRLPNWIDLYALLEKEIVADSDFHSLFVRTMFDQYVYLLNHLEKHLLANHYFEDLKALVIASTFFGDDRVQEIAAVKLLEQCAEQILADGMQYERSPMYQKILLEDLIRVEAALESSGRKNKDIRQYIRKMLDVSYSLEFGLDRLPLFNDCGKNIAKSLNALVKACQNRLEITPERKNSFPDSGFYVFDFADGCKLVVDGGQPGPDYSPGHAHCEAMSFELFQKGKPIFVNCGTFAYQCEQRSFFKSTQAHNTARVNGAEQSECWSSFRMARRARIKNVQYEKHGISMCVTDYLGHPIKRTIRVNVDSVEIIDESDNASVESYLHFTDHAARHTVTVQAGEASEFRTPYAEEFGKQTEIPALKISGMGLVKYTIRVGNE